MARIRRCQRFGGPKPSLGIPSRGLFWVTWSWRSFSPSFMPNSFGLAAQAPARLWEYWSRWSMQALITFAVQPLTTKILGGWIVGDLIQFAIAGAIIGAI